MNRGIDGKTIDSIYKYLECQPGNLIEYLAKGDGYDLDYEIFGCVLRRTFFILGGLIENMLRLYDVITMRHLTCTKVY